MINKTILQGRLTADPELKHVGDNISVCEFTVAWSEKYKEIEKKCFLRCKVWRGTAEFLEKFFTKGSELLVEGSLVTEEWEKDGEKKSRTMLNVEKVHFCGSKKDSAPQTTSTGAPVPEGFQAVDDDDIPF